MGRNEVGRQRLPTRPKRGIDADADWPDLRVEAGKEAKMNSSELTEIKEDWLANSAITAFLGSLLVGQSWERWAGSESTTKLLNFNVPDATELVNITIVFGLLAFSLFLAASSLITPLQRFGIGAARSASPIMLPIVSTSFIMSWLSSSLKLPFDQWWASVLFIGGFVMLIFVGFRPMLTPVFRYLGGKLRRNAQAEKQMHVEQDGSSDRKTDGTDRGRGFPVRMGSFRRYSRPLKSGKFWIALSVAVFVVAAVVVAVQWDWLSDDESTSATIRNIGLVVAGMVALPLAVWRALVADRQASAAQQQADSARGSMLNDRYQKGAEMLGSEALSVRTGGIYALRSLSEEHADSYHLQVMQVFCSFVRYPTKDDGTEFRADSDEEEDERMLRADVQDIMRAIGSRDPASICLEREEDFKLYLRGADLSYMQVRSARLSSAWLTKADLSGSELRHADLSGARMRQADLSGAKLHNADLSEAQFWSANLSNAMLRDANLSGADFCGVDAKSAAYRESARGLTQGQLDDAWADPDNPPKLDGVLDADTGQQLVWRGRTG